jgi:hypothetical protein
VVLLRERGGGPRSRRAAGVGPAQQVIRRHEGPFPWIRLTLRMFGYLRRFSRPPKRIPSCARPNIRSAARYVSPSDALRIVERRRWQVKKAA